MKNLFTLTLLCFGTLSAWAQIPTTVEETVEIERSRGIYSLTIDMNPQTVRCLVGDYGASSLKISIPEMKIFTVFPHTTRGEVEPCINAGACTSPFVPGGLTPESVLNPAKPTEEIQLTVVLTEVLTLNHDLKTCTRELRENVHSPVRGLQFVHQDGAWLGETNYDVCLKMKEIEAKKN